MRDGTKSPFHPRARGRDFSGFLQIATLDDRFIPH